MRGSLRWVGWVVVICVLAVRAGAKSPAPEAVAPVPAAVELPALPDEKAVPWGEAADGLAVRVIVPAEACPGQAVGMTVQVKNISRQPQIVPKLLSPAYKQLVALEVKGPDGKALRQSVNVQFRVGPESFAPLAPGESMRFDLPDVRALFAQGGKPDPLAAEGKYTLTYRIVGPRLIGRQVQTPVSNEASFAVVPLKEEDLAVHEWGVFTVFNDLKYANVNRKAEWGGLPEFFYRQFPAKRLRWAPAAWDKPVIYFYTKRPAMRVGVTVKFAGGGAPVVWWPAAAEPVDEGSGEGEAVPSTGAGKTFDSLRWDAWLGPIVTHDGPFGQAGTTWVRATATALPADSWLAAARLADASMVSVTGSQVERGRPWSTDRVESERFIYYDGLVPAPDNLRCVRADDGSVTVRSGAGFEIKRLYVVDRRKKGAVGVAAPREALAAGAEMKVALEPAGGAAVPEAFVERVRADLIEAGLFEAEADAMLKIWQRGLFENEGVVAFHVLPRAEYERMLPLTVTPKPVKDPVRVGLAFHPNLEAEPAIAGRVAGLIKQLDAEDYAARRAARAALAGVGPVAVRMLREAAETSDSAEVRDAAAQIAEDVDASGWLGAAGAGK